MKNILQTLLLGALTVGSAVAQTTVTGPSSSQSPYVTPAASGVTITSILTATDIIGGYKMCGTPDGLGAYDNGNGTFTLLMNHEFGNGAGGQRAHGSVGSFVSKWVINKTTLAVVSGADLIQNVNLWTGTTYTTYNYTTPSTLAAFARFCSADLAPATAFYNAHTGLGTEERIFMNGEENGNEGRMMAHIVTGSAAGDSYELPYLGKFSAENYVACPYSSNKTIVAGMDDQTPGQVYFYIGTKTNTGTDIDKAGLSNGKVFGVSVTGLLTEVNASFPAANTTFTLVDLGNVSAITGASLNTMSNNNGVTSFLRPEDGAWDPANPRDFYFVTTNGFNSNSRLWRLRFTDINNPELGGTITAVLDGSEGQQMFDNLTIDNSGHVLLVEDVGNNAHLGKVWQYNTFTDALTQIASHDATRFITGGPNFLTQDEECSGILDVQSILGPGMFIAVDQAHYGIPGDVVEGGQIITIYNPSSFNANPEINIQGNSTNITDGSSTTSAGNNTNYGLVGISFPQSKTFVIQNSGPGTLTVTGVNVSGPNASEFTLVSPPAFPLTIAASGAQTLTVQFSPTAAGLRTATLNVNSNDLTEAWYDFKIEGNAMVTTGISALSNAVELISLYPNPTKDEATVKIVSEHETKATINIYDIQGRSVKLPIERNAEKGDNLVSISTTDLKNGLYFVEVITATKTTKIEMVVSH